MNLTKSIAHIGEDKLPVFLKFEEQVSTDFFADWYHEKRELMESTLLRNGAIHVRGINIDSIDAFSGLMKRLHPASSSFLDGNSSRSKHTSNVYNASEYDAASIIRLHTEFSYSNLWPAHIFFCCINKADTGGETTVGDCKKVLELLSPAIVEEFEAKGITYIRNLHGGAGLGPSWQEAFETTDKQFMESYCNENGITVKWQPDGAVRLEQTRPAIRKHPVTGDRLWFNQVDQFYPVIYGEEVFETLMFLANNDPNGLPMYARYGDGSEIQKEYIDEIIRVMDDVTVPVPWENGDLLMVDNMLSLHGRLPFTGDRKILVSMA
ncbi:TauD/TfdA family dioxygenase [Chitinophaga filiformis]|uniref:TauD/TfdA family dioxygenase n=1 Tax=Chitinophaga filiformis TaxID=104663 RepID=UPI001F461A1B|nr:TauD/TfdA family dioxygenase [Chitinophaga filiformis]MCF6402535.1 TauD/TfdA family dioxygenase [Chitinophaga filiformis]MCF6403547.1 TauD/TfdA family dioxygenase [Chitinophaga filiformis]